MCIYVYLYIYIYTLYSGGSAAAQHAACEPIIFSKNVKSNSIKYELFYLGDIHF